ncbi:MAG: hypothetical protein WAP20_01580, partial [Limnochordia bacterium]|nr:hypothetical protein [Bacillota bacterium]
NTVVKPSSGDGIATSRGERAARCQEISLKPRKCTGVRLRGFVFYFLTEALGDDEIAALVKR